MEFSLVHMWASMGLVAKGVVYVLLAMSVATFAIAIERFVAFFRAGKQSQLFAAEIAGPLDERAFAEVTKRRESHPLSPLAQVVGNGVAEFSRSLAARERSPRRFRPRA